MKVKSHFTQTEAGLERQRLLILGASGWFGQTMQTLVAKNTPIMATASSRRPPYELWDYRAIRDFAPTLVANFAFLTPNKLAKMSLDEYEQANRSLIGQFIQSIELPTVRAVLCTSSGAATRPGFGVYGRLKSLEEALARERNTSERRVVVARVYSVSGPLVRTPHDYAFSSLISQALAGNIQIKASNPTYRRYSSVRDVLSVGLGFASSGFAGVFESGGELIEIGELARRVVSLVNPACGITRVRQTSHHSSVYASDNVSWQSACERVGLKPMDLSAQVLAVAEALSPRPQTQQAGTTNGFLTGIYSTKQLDNFGGASE